MAIDGEDVGTIRNLLTLQTTTEGSFRSGITSTVNQVDATEIRLRPLDTAKVSQLGAINASADEINVLDNWTGDQGDLDAAKRVNDARLADGNVPPDHTGANIRNVLSYSSTTGYTWVPQNSSLIFRDGDGDPVTLDNGEYLMFTDGQGISIDFTDTSDGTSADPFDLTIGLVGTNLSGVSATRDTQVLSGNSEWFTPPDTTYSNGAGLSLSGTTFSVNFGTGTDNAVRGNDARLSDSRAPTAHNQAASTITSGTFATNAVYTFLNEVRADNFCVTSDVRLKDNVETLEDSLEKIKSLRGVSYTMKDKSSVGLIAQEVEKVIPEVVTTGDDGMKGVAYSQLVGVLIEAVKELSSQVEELKNGTST